MEMEYKDPSKRGRWLVLAGVVLAVVAGGAAFFLINNAQQQAGQSGLKTTSAVVAVRPIPARKPIEAEDVALRSDIPLDGTNAEGIVTDPAQVVGRILAVEVKTGPAPDDEPARVGHGRRRVLDPRAGRDRRPRVRGVARRVADRHRRPRGRRHARPGHARGRVHDGERQRPAVGPRRGHVLHGPVDEDQLPGHGDPARARARTTSSRRRSRSRRRSATSRPRATRSSAWCCGPTRTRGCST